MEHIKHIPGQLSLPLCFVKTFFKILYCRCKMPLSGKASKPDYKDIIQEKKIYHRDIQLRNMVLAERDCIGQSHLGLILVCRYTRSILS